MPEGAAGVIDLHLHTTASDGRSRARGAGRSGLASRYPNDERDRSRHCCCRRAGGGERGPASGIALMSGIEITGRPRGPRRPRAGLLHRPLTTRSSWSFWSISVPTACGACGDGGSLAALGKPIDRASLQGSSDRARPRDRTADDRPGAGKAGHVADIRQAFDQLIGDGQPAFVPRQGAAPAEVIASFRPLAASRRLPTRGCSAGTT